MKSEINKLQKIQVQKKLNTKFVTDFRLLKAGRKFYGGEGSPRCFKYKMRNTKWKYKIQHLRLISSKGKIVKCQIQNGNTKYNI